MAPKCGSSVAVTTRDDDPTRPLSDGPDAPTRKLSAASDAPTRKLSAASDAPTRKLSAASDAPTRKLSAASDAPTRKLSAALRGALADTRPLQTPAYRRLWTAGLVTVVGAQLTVVAVPTQIYQLTGSSAYVGLTGLFGLVPLVVFGLWGGAIADAVDRRLLLLLTGSGIAAVSLALWVCAATAVANVWVVLCCSPCSRRSSR